MWNPTNCPSWKSDVEDDTILAVLAAWLWGCQYQSVSLVHHFGDPMTFFCQHCSVQSLTLRAYPQAEWRQLGLFCTLPSSWLWDLHISSLHIAKLLHLSCEGEEGGGGVIAVVSSCNAPLHQVALLPQKAVCYSCSCSKGWPSRPNQQETTITSCCFQSISIKMSGLPKAAHLFLCALHVGTF